MTQTTRQFGIEIEANGAQLHEVVDMLTAAGINVRTRTNYTHQVMPMWKVVPDGSLGNNSFEVVSPPLSGAEGLAEVRKVMDVLNEAGCDVNKSCGMHVHIDCNDLTAEHIANIFNRYRKHEAEIDKMMPKSRRGSNSRWCKTLQHQRVSAIAGSPSRTCSQMTGRYYKVNLTAFAKYGTVEFRQHSGSLNGAKAANWIKFLQAFVEASRPVAAAATTTQRNLRGKTKSIVELLQQDWHTPHDLARRVETNENTVRGIIGRIRKRYGYNVELSHGCYRIRQTATTTTTATHDSVWNGVDDNTRRYYGRRIAHLAS